MTITVDPLWILLGLGVFMFAGWFLRGVRERQRRENAKPDGVNSDAEQWLDEHSLPPVN